MSALENKNYFDLSKDVAGLEDNQDDFLVELFSSDARAQRLVHVNPKQDDPNSVEFVSKRAEFQTHLPVPLKLKGTHWEMSLAQACFRNQRSAVYKLQFKDSRHVNSYEMFFPRRPYATPFELYEEVAKLSLDPKFHSQVYWATDDQRVTGGTLTDNIPAQLDPDLKNYNQHCINGPKLEKMDSSLYGEELVDPITLWQYFGGIWNDPHLQVTWEWTAPGSFMNPYIDGNTPFSDFFFWDTTNTAFDTAYLKDASGNPILPAGQVLGAPPGVKKLPRVLDGFWFRGNFVTFPTLADGTKCIRFRLVGDTVFYFVISRRLAQLLNIDKMKTINVDGAVWKWEKESDDDMLVIGLAINIDLKLPREMWITTEKVEQAERPILILDEKGLIELPPAGDSLFVPDFDGREIEVSAGCWAWDGDSQQLNYKIRSLPKIRCSLWDETEFGHTWDPAKSWWNLLNSFNKRLECSEQGVLNEETIENEWKLWTGDIVSDYDPNVQWPKVLVYEYMDSESGVGGSYQVKPGELLPQSIDLNFWKLGSPSRIFEKDANDKIATYLPFDPALINSQVFWMMLPKKLVTLLDLESWATKNRTGDDLLAIESRYQNIRLAQVPWDLTKQVVYWVATLPPRDFKQTVPTQRDDLPQVLQTRWHGVTKILPNLVTPSLNSNGDIEFSMRSSPYNPTASVTIIDSFGFPVLDTLNNFVMQKDKLTSYFFQPWSHPGYLDTIILSILELGVRDVILSFHPKSSQFTKLNYYQHHQGIVLPQDEPLVVFQGSTRDYIKLRERKDSGIDTLTVQLKSLDGTQFPPFYIGLTYIALHFRKALSDLELEEDSQTS